MNLVIDIGNTLTKLAWFDQGEIVESLRLEQPVPRNFLGVVRKRPAEAAILSSVGTTSGDMDRDWEKDLRNLIVLDHRTPLPFKLVYKTPETLGRDRIAACAGAWHLYPGHPLVIMDLGTAITIDFISADGEYPGGNISPGMYTRFKALHAFTAKLPLVEHDPSFPPFGTDTRSAIASGVQEGIVFELNGYVEDFMTRYPGCKFIMTGGDASLFMSRLNGTIIHMPELVLKGLNCILEYNLSFGRHDNAI
jgi:type III pantothenate kinase